MGVPCPTCVVQCVLSRIYDTFADLICGFFYESYFVSKLQYKFDFLFFFSWLCLLEHCFCVFAHADMVSHLALLPFLLGEGVGWELI